MIILTGASGGIGQGLMPYLCEMDDVLGLYCKTKPTPQAGDTANYEQLDITDSAAVQNFAHRCCKTASRITLIHAAGLNINGIAMNYKIENWRRTLDINLTANFLLSQAFLPKMIRENWGRIIHMSSQIGIEGVPGTIAYSASKMALHGLSHVLANEYRPYNITSNVLALGNIRTGMFLKLTDKEKEVVDNYVGCGELPQLAAAIQELIEVDTKTASIIHIGAKNKLP